MTSASFFERVKNVFFRRRIQAYSGGGFPPSGYYSGGAGIVVTEETTMRCSTVLACIRTLCEDVSLPVCVKRKTASGWQEVPSHPVNQLLSRGPNPYMTSSELIQKMMLDCLLHGHFANYVLRDARGRIEAIYPLQANLLTLVKPLVFSDTELKSGTTPLQYIYGGPEFGRRSFSSFDLWQGRLLPSPYLTDPSLGRNAITLLAREAIGLSLAMEKQGARLFSNGLQTKFAIVSQADLDEPQKEELRKSFARNQGAENAWRPVVLENGVDIKDIGLTPEDSQYIEARKFQKRDICMVFRVPPYLVGETENLSTYGSQEQAALQYVKTGILPWLTRIEQTAKRDLFSESESDLFLRHDLTHLLKADQQTRYKCWQLGISSGFLTPNDCREFEGLSREPGLDSFLRPSTLQPVVEEPTVPPVKPNGHDKHDTKVF